MHDRIDRALPSPTGQRLFCLVFVLSLLLSPAAMRAAAVGSTLTATVTPTGCTAGGTVTYTLTLTHPNTTALEGLSVRHVLPEGFTYQAGTTKVVLNGATVSSANPSISGRTLTWASLRLTGGRTDGYYGMHTFVQRRPDDGGYANMQLDKTVQLMGTGAYVTQLLDWIDPSWQGPPTWMFDFVNRAYDRSLTPIVRLALGYGGQSWYKPKPDANGSYTTIAQTFKRVVQGLPRRDGKWLYIQIWNEPNLNLEWEGQANPAEYGKFLVDVATALRSIGDPRIVLLNGPLSPGGEYYYLDYLEAMLNVVPQALWAFDVWASHPYPNNHPPEYNIHDGTAAYKDATIDLYLRELEVLARHGRSGLKVLLTETGYALYQCAFGFEGYPAVNESNRADYILRAYRDYWSQWPEIIGVCPYELVDANGEWAVWDWLYADGRSHAQYETVKAWPKAVSPVSSVLRLTFKAKACSTAGTFYSDVSATASNGAIPATTHCVPVTVSVPATATPTATLPPGVTPTATPTCPELLANGSFETDEAWEIAAAPVPSAYSTAQHHSGTRAMRSGIESGTNTRSYSTVSQYVTIPANAASARLVLWYNLTSADLLGDYAYIAVLPDGDTSTRLATLRENGQTWQRAEYPLDAYKGQRVRIDFGVYNDGANGMTHMFTDDVSVTWCGAVVAPTTTPARTVTPTMTPTSTHTPTTTPTNTPVPTATPTRTPVPGTGCDDLMTNGGFEMQTIGWELPGTAYPAGRVASPVHAGQGAIRIGMAEDANVYSYSSAWQAVAVPADAGDPVLTFWCSLVTNADGQDRQYALLQDEHGVALATLFNGLVDAPGWAQKQYSLAAYQGRTIRLFFGVYNDGAGGATTMYVDDVSVMPCSQVAPTPTPTRVLGEHQLFLPLIRGPLEGGTQPGPASAGPQGAAQAQPASADLRAVWSAGQPALGRRPAQSVAADPAHDVVYVAADAALWVLDAASGQTIKRIDLPAAARGLAIDVSRQRLYAALWAANALAVIDTAEQALVCTIDGIGGASGVAACGEHVYATATRDDTLVVLDAPSYAIIKRIEVGDAPYALACDPDGHRVFVANAGAGTVSLVELAAGTQWTAELGGLGHPQGLAFDPVRNRLYITYSLAPKYQAIAAIDASTGAIVSRLTGNREQPLAGVGGIAVDSFYGWVYVTTTTEAWTLTGDTLRLVHAAPVAGPAFAFGLSVDPAQGQLYLADGRDGSVAALHVGR